MTEEKQQPNETTESADPAADAGGPEALTQLKIENEQLKSAVRLGEAHRQITAELARAGARSPEVLFASVRDDLQFTDEGKVMNTAALIARLKKDFPEQFGNDAGAGSIDAGSGNAAPVTLSPASLAKMTPAEIAKLDWEVVRRVLAQQD